jgi:flagellar biosynthetic protein FliR
VGEVFALEVPYLYVLHILMVSVRIGAMLAFSPIWGNPALPVQVRFLLIFATAAGVAPVVTLDPRAVSHPLLVIPGEFFIGLLLGMGLRIAFAVLHFAGQLVGFSVGFSAVTAIDPQTQNRSTLMAGYFTLIGYALFLAANQHHEFIRAMKESYVSFPLGGLPAVSSWFELLMTAAGNIFTIGWKIGFPLFVVVLLGDVAVGFLARLQPQMNAIVLAMPLKVIVGLLMLGASLVVFPSIMRELADIVVLR